MAEYYHSMDREYFRGVEPEHLAVSTPPFEHQLTALKTRVRQGAKVIELGFTGTEKGNKQSPTPEMYTKEERAAMKELAKVNDLTLSTHGTVGSSGFAGFTGQGFNEEAASKSFWEIQRAIDFAADVTDGGAVVFHTGEWIRPVSEAGQFESYEGQEAKGEYKLANKKTGQIMEFDRTQVRHVPIFETDEEGNIKKDERGHDIYKTDENGLIQTKELGFKEAVDNFREKFKGTDLLKSKDGRKLSDDEIFLKTFIQEQIAGQEAENVRWRTSAEEYQKAGRPKEDYQWMINAAENAAQQVANIKEKYADFESIDRVGSSRAADTLAKAGFYAFQKQKEQGLKKDLFISPEGYMPEHYGSHPQEIAEMVEKGRAKLAQSLQEHYGMDSSEADKQAEKNIRATMDVGHLYNWRRVFQRKVDKDGKIAETLEQQDKRFNKWLVDEIKDLNKRNIIGHVHISDNFGYYDEHISPGQGKAPIQEFMKEIKKANDEGAEIISVIEPNHEDIRAWTDSKSWLAAQTHTLGNWGDVHQGYFGRNEPTRFAYGDLVPGNREWQKSYFDIPFE